MMRKVATGAESCAASGCDCATRVVMPVTIYRVEPARPFRLTTLMHSSAGLLWIILGGLLVWVAACGGLITWLV
jgi:hypothetical protein